MASSDHSQSEYSADASGYVTAKPKANPTPNQERTVSDDLESNHNASAEPTSDSDSSASSTPVVPLPTPDMPEPSRGPRLRVTARKSVPIPRRAFADRVEAPAPTRVIPGVPIGRVSGMTWAEEQHFRTVSAGVQSSHTRLNHQSQVITELVELTHLLTNSSTEALDAAREARIMASVAALIWIFAIALLGLLVIWVGWVVYWY